MPFYNAFKFGNETELLKLNPYNQGADDFGVLPPPPAGFFLEFQNGGVPFLLLDGQYMTLL